jgi:hypothetical protein
MKLITLTLILLATLVIPAKEKDSDCIKELNKCRNTCYAEGIKPDGECILKCYKFKNKEVKKCQV